jgi:hypothetical protein
MKFLKVLILILILTRVGVAYGDTESPLTIRNFFLGSSPQGDANVNQVLALLIGPEGKPGPAGIAGRDGFVGMNGLDGKDGIPGAPGPVGPQGLRGEQGVQGAVGLQGATGPAGAIGARGPMGPAGASGTLILMSIVESGTAECNGIGGTKFTSGGVTTFACNGSGSSGSPAFSFGQGTVQLGVCDRDASVGFTFATRWDGSDFYLDGVTISEVDGRCIDQTLKVYFKVKSSAPIYIPTAPYGLNDIFICSKVLTPTEPGLGGSPRTLLNNSFKLQPQTSCAHTDAAGNSLTAVQLGAIGSRDLAEIVGFEIS